MRGPWLAVSLALGVIAGASACADGPIYLFSECEAVLQGPGWITSPIWTPSAGLFLYSPVDEGQTATGSVTLPHRGRWRVWLRARAECLGVRRGYAEVNGVRSYVVGGTDSWQWVWYLVGTVNDDRVDLVLHDVSPTPMDEGFDALLVTDDPGFVPPPEPPGPEGYAGYRRDADAMAGRRPAWIWWPRHPMPGSTGYYRREFTLPAKAVAAVLTISALGAHHTFINGQRVADSLRPGTPDEVQVAGLLRPGRNVIGVELLHLGYLPGVNVHLGVTHPNRSQTTIVSDPSWNASSGASEGWQRAGYNDALWRQPWARIGEKPMVGYDPNPGPGDD